jgi:ACS family 4-hydroxyphenylacetate permease-like MFS transporter
MAEAGFVPGILLYLTYWFPRTCRARANAPFIMGIPATIAIASTLSGFILQMAFPAGRSPGGHPRDYLPFLSR